MVEARTTGSNLIGQIGPNLEANLPKYIRTTPEERSREMQAAAFGEKTEQVSKFEYVELIETVRAIRPWLKENGRTASDHPDFVNTPGHEIYWISDAADLNSPYISFEPRPWEQQSGKNLEAYPKFTVEAIVAGNEVQFELNFDDTYYLSIGKSDGTIRFVSSHLSRREMTKQEYVIVKTTISQATAHYTIPI